MFRVIVLGILASAICAPLALSAQTPSEKAAVARPVAPVNLNTATAQELETLPGIGAKTAELIVAYRTKNGAFKKAEELMNVKGIGEKSFLRIRALVVVTPVKSEAEARSAAGSAR
jgi:competence protein ComEA